MMNPTKVYRSDYKTEADFWNAEGQAMIDQTQAFIEALPAGTIQSDHDLRHFQTPTPIQKWYLNRISRFGNLGTITFVWHEDFYYTFASDAFKVSMLFDGFEAVAVDGVLTLCLHPQELEALNDLSNALRYQVNRYN